MRKSQKVLVNQGLTGAGPRAQKTYINQALTAKEPGGAE